MKENPSDIAKRLIELCDTYVDLGGPNLLRAGKKQAGSNTFDGGIEMMRVRFFFPNLEQKGWELIYRLALFNWQYRGLEAGKEQSLPFRQDLELARELEYSEAAYDQVKAQVLMASSPPSMTLVQKEILKQLYGVSE